MLESVKFVHSLVHEHGVAPSVEGVNPYELFPAGTIAMTGAGRWPFDTYVTTGYKDVDITPGRATEKAQRSSVPAAGPSPRRLKTSRWRLN